MFSGYGQFTANTLAFSLLSPAHFPLPLVFFFSVGDGLPLHVARMVLASARERPHVVNDVTLTWPLGGSRCGTGLRLFELDYGGLAPLSAGSSWQRLNPLAQSG